MSPTQQPDAQLLGHLLAQMEATEAQSLTSTLAEEARKALRDKTLVERHSETADALRAALASAFLALLALPHGRLRPTMMGVIRRFLRDHRPTALPVNEAERLRQIGKAVPDALPFPAKQPPTEPPDDSEPEPHPH